MRGFKTAAALSLALASTPALSLSVTVTDDSMSQSNLDCNAPLDNGLLIPIHL